MRINAQFNSLAVHFSFCAQRVSEYESIADSVNSKTIPPTQIMNNSPPEHQHLIQDPRTRNFVVSILAGGIAGTCEILTMYPLDLVKTQAQLSVGKSATIAGTFKRIVREHGFSALYRGIAAPIVAEAPKRAMKFTCNEIYKPLFKGNEYVLGAVAAGTAAGMTEALINCPAELAKVRLQSEANRALYNNTMDAVVKIVKNEGPLALYNGLEAQLWRNGIWNGVYFGCILAIRRQLPTPQSKTQELLQKFLAGFIGGTAATTLNTPFDVCKSRIQDQKLVKGQVPKYGWTLPSMATVAREEGTSALYKGYVARVMRLGPGGGIMLICFHYMSGFLNQYL